MGFELQNSGFGISDSNNCARAKEQGTGTDEEPIKTYIWFCFEIVDYFLNAECANDPPWSDWSGPPVGCPNKLTNPLYHQTRIVNYQFIGMRSFIFAKFLSLSLSISIYLFIFILPFLSLNLPIFIVFYFHLSDLWMLNASFACFFVFDGPYFTFSCLFKTLQLE